MANRHGPEIKNDDTYEALRRKGASKEKAARIANAQANPDQHPSKKGGKASPYEEWTKSALYERAKQIDIEGRSKMTRDELIKSLRD